MAKSRHEKAIEDLEREAEALFQLAENPLFSEFGRTTLRKAGTRNMASARHFRAVKAA